MYLIIMLMMKESFKQSIIRHHNRILENIKWFYSNLRITILHVLFDLLD